LRLNTSPSMKLTRMIPRLLTGRRPHRQTKTSMQPVCPLLGTRISALTRSAGLRLVSCCVGLMEEEGWGCLGRDGQDFWGRELSLTVVYLPFPFDSMKPGMGRKVFWLAPLSHHIITIYYINLCAQRANGVMGCHTFWFLFLVEIGGHNRRRG